MNSTFSPAPFPDTTKFIGNTMGPDELTPMVQHSTNGMKGGKAKKHSKSPRKHHRHSASKSNSKHGSKILPHQMPLFKNNENLLKYSPQFGGGEPPVIPSSGNPIPNESHVPGQPHLEMSSTFDGSVVKGTGIVGGSRRHRRKTAKMGKSHRRRSYRRR